MAEQTITCPNCGTAIPLSEALSRQLMEQLRKQFEGEIKARNKELDTKQETLVQKELELKEKGNKIDSLVEEKLILERTELEKNIQQQSRKAIEIELKDLNEQIVEKDNKLKEVQSGELELRKKNRALEEKIESLDLEVARKVDAERENIVKGTTQKIREEFELKLKEMEYRNKSLTNQITDLKRSAEQGSQQIQGEILELSLQEILERNFPCDKIMPVPSGMSGADIIHEVHDDLGTACGVIIWESKRTKNWSDTWIDKLKADQREAKAEIAVILSATLPNDLENFAFRNGVWVTNYSSLLGLTAALRFAMIEIAKARQSNLGKDQKMEFLYQYLCGHEFRGRVEGIIEAFTELKMELDREKVAISKIWSRREKQIQRVIENTVSMYGSMQGIIGASFPQIEVLEIESLPPDDEA